MSKELDFYFDYGSPTAYLAYARLQQLQSKYALTINYLPMLLGGVFKATENTSPVTIPAKAAYMLQQDLPRFSRRYGVPLNFNPYFPINTLHLMRGAFAATTLGALEDYTAAVFTAMWVEERNMGDADVVGQTLADAGLDAERLMALAQTPATKAQLIAATEAAVKRGCFGAPTFFMEGEMYFGQDRLDFVAEALQCAK